MRDFIRLIQNAANYAQMNGKERIETTEASEVLNDLRRQLSALLTPKYQTVLDNVRATQDRTDNDECDDLLRNNIVLSYVNDDIWYHVHSGLSKKPW